MSGKNVGFPLWFDGGKKPLGTEKTRNMVV